MIYDVWMICKSKSTVWNVRRPCSARCRESATMKYGDLEQTFDRYEPFGYRSVIVTKCDETESFGNVLSILHKTQKPVSWITDGQKILLTIWNASPSFFKEWFSGFYDQEESWLLMRKK